MTYSLGGTTVIYANTITTHIQKNLSLEKLSQETIRLQNQVEKLKKLQNADGSFSWWKGMKGSRYMTGSKRIPSLHRHSR